MDWLSRVETFWKRNKELVLDSAAVAKLCPSCAEKMKGLGIIALTLKANSVPPEMVQGLCDSLGGAEGFFDRCMGHDFGDFSPDDKEAFCAWLHNECLGKFPSQDALTDYDKWLREGDLKALESYRQGMGPAPVLTKDGGSLVKVEAEGPVLFVASEETEDRLGDVITTAGWQLENYRKNPVFLFAHDQSIPPIGMSAKTWTEGKQLLAQVRFDEQDDFAQLVKGKYQRKFLRAVSVGFKALEFEERKLDQPGPDRDYGLLFKRQELVEISAVPVPAHPAALAKIFGPRPIISVPSEAYSKRFEAVEARVARLEQPHQIETIDLRGVFERIWQLGKEDSHV